MCVQVRIYGFQWLRESSGLMFSSQRLLNLCMTHIWSTTANDLTIRLSASPWSCLSTDSIFNISSHIQKDTPTCAGDYLSAMKGPGALSSIQEGLEPWENRWYFVACKYVTYIGKQIASRRIFSWCDLKCSCWDGSIKGRASSLIH